MNPPSHPVFDMLMDVGARPMMERVEGTVRQALWAVVRPSLYRQMPDGSVQVKAPPLVLALEGSGSHGEAIRDAVDLYFLKVAGEPDVTPAMPRLDRYVVECSIDLPAGDSRHGSFSLTYLMPGAANADEYIHRLWFGYLAVPWYNRGDWKRTRDYSMGQVFASAPAAAEPDEDAPSRPSGELMAAPVKRRRRPKSVSAS